MCGSALTDFERMGDGRADGRKHEDASNNGWVECVANSALAQILS